MSDHDRHLGPRTGSWGLWPVIGLAAAGVLIALLPISPPIRAAAMFVAGMAALLGARRIERMRARELADLERHARQLLAPDDDHGEPTRQAPEPPDAGGADPVRSLRETLEVLAAERSRRLKELAKKSRNLEALIHALDEPVLATDDQERVLLCNRAAEELFNAAPGQLLGRPIAALFTHDQVRAMHGAARRGETHRGRVRLTTAAGTRVFQVSAAPVPVAWGEGVFGAVLLLRDVTELDRAVQVKSDFVANASHELRTPVAAIRAAVETLTEGLKDDPPMPAEMRDRLLGMVRSHAERLEEMVRDLLDLSMLESPDVQVSVATVEMKEVEASLRGMFEEACRAKGLELVFEIAPGAERVETDPRLLRLILRNLVENAVKFAYERTRVVVAARPSAEREGWVRFEVRDRGIGVPLHLRERVFERYFQADSARSGPRRGTGLGLAIVKHAVRALGGEVGLESVYKEGTTVWVEAPAGRREAA